MSAILRAPLTRRTASIADPPGRGGAAQRSAHDRRLLNRLPEGPKSAQPSVDRSSRR